VESHTRIELPSQVARPFEVFVNGVPQVEGTDFEHVGTALIFSRGLAREGKLGFWRWTRMILGVAGSYRQNDTIDLVYTLNGRRTVASLAPPDSSASSASQAPAADGGEG
jgi:hypothetical protein